MKAEQEHIFTQYRKDHGTGGKPLSESALAGILGCSRSLISLIELGIRPITPENAKEWERKINLTKEQMCPEIFGASEEKKAA